MSIISINHIKMKYYEDIVLHDVHVDVHAADKIGLVGNNGSGKTSLFKVILGEEQPIAGDVYIKNGTTIGYLPQIPSELGAVTVAEVLRQPFRVLDEQEDAMRQLEADMANGRCDDGVLAQYSRIQLAYEAAGGYQIDQTIKTVTTALHLQALTDQTFDVLSGGEKTRVALAKVLLTAPDLLLLDEPTNHLDIDMLAWLEDYISRYRGAVVIISHDRYFLDQVAEKIIELSGGYATSYIGNYSFYMLEKQRAYQRQLKAYREQQRLIKNIKAAIDRFRLWGAKGDNEKFFNKARQFQKKLDDMALIERPSDDVEHFDIAVGQLKKSSKRMVAVEQLTMRYADNAIFRDVDFEILRGEKVCLIGANGVGKSTIIKLLMGELKPTAGQVKVADSAHIGYLAQQVSFADEMMSLVDYVSEQAGLLQGQARNLLAQYGFRGEEVFRRINTLSGGEKSRIILMLFSLANYNLMVLDEPTNHLDIQSKEKLESELESYGATLLFVSHDRYFINRIANRVLLLQPDGVISYPGNYDDFLAAKSKRQTQIDRQTDRARNRAAKPKRRQADNTAQKCADQMAATIEALDVKIAQLNADKQLHSSDYQALQAIDEQIKQLQCESDELMIQWLNSQDE